MTFLGRLFSAALCALALAPACLWAGAVSPDETKKFFSREPWGGAFKPAVNAARLEWLARLYQDMAAKDAAALLPEVLSHGVSISVERLAEVVSAARAGQGLRAGAGPVDIPRSRFAAASEGLSSARTSLAQADDPGRAFDGSEAARWTASASFGSGGFVSLAGGVAAPDFDAEISGYRAPGENVRSGVFAEQRFPVSRHSIGAGLFAGLGPAESRPTVVALKGSHPLAGGSVTGEWALGSARYAGPSALRQGFGRVGVTGSFWDEALTLTMAASKAFSLVGRREPADDAPSGLSLHRLHPSAALESLEEFPDSVASVDLIYTHPSEAEASFSYAYVRRLVGGAAHSVVSALGVPIAQHWTARLSHQFSKAAGEAGDNGFYLNMDFEAPILASKSGKARAQTVAQEP